MSQTIDLIKTIETNTGSSKTELSSRGKRPFNVRRSGANYGPCPSARKRPALITDPQKVGPTLNIGPAVIMDFKVDGNETARRDHDKTKTRPRQEQDKTRSRQDQNKTKTRPRQDPDK